MAVRDSGRGHVHRAVARDVVRLRVYVANFSNYDVMYGSIGGLILFMLWLFLTSVVLLLGAEINRVIRETARQPSAPLRQIRPLRARAGG